MPDPVKLLSMLRRATDLFRSTPGRRGGVITVESALDVLVVGDLHGNLPFFRKVLEESALAKNPQRHLVLQELIHGSSFYPDDGGDKSHQLVDLVCRAEVPVPRPGPPDPGQPRALRADGAPDRQERRHAQRHVSPGDRDELRHACRRDLRVLPGPLRRAPPGGPDPQPRLPLPHDPRHVRDRSARPGRARGRRMVRRGDATRRDRVCDDMGAEHRPRDRRPLRRDGGRRPVHHRPPALRRGLPPGQPPPAHHRRHRPVPDLLPLPRPRAHHDRDPARGRPRPAEFSESRATPPLASLRLGITGPRDVSTGWGTTPGG